MKEFYRKVIRASGRISDILVFTAILCFVVSILGAFPGQLIINCLTPFLEKLAGNEGAADFLGRYLNTIGAWIAGLLFIAIFRKNHPMFKSLAYKKGGNDFKNLGIGLLLGLGTNGICILFSWLSGDIKLSFFGFDFILLLAFFIAVFCQSSSEELIMRVYAYQKLRRRYRHPLIAIIGNGVVFALMHAFNPGFTLIAASQIFLIGVIFSLLIYYYDSFWMASAFHAGWNYSQSIIFGLPNSGLVSAYSLFNLEAASARDGLFYNVNFGVEGSIGSSIILLIILAAIILMNRGKKEKTDLWADMEYQEEIRRQQKEAEKNKVENGQES
ncbi:MAG: CPBP family intramembrane metalloprotease [Erysipelotrichaceae bacterium]|nr:CPBP family intramembrane metalloprotease [Erysipelotrichaceae bacterium]